MPTETLCWQEFFSRWSSKGIVDFKDELADLIILTASRTLLGVLVLPGCLLREGANFPV